jgi:hypothetical protein
LTDLLPLTLAGAGSVLLLLAAVAALVLIVLARRQIAIRWHRIFSEPADAGRARGDVGEAVAYGVARDMARRHQELDLRVFPGRRFHPTEVDLLVVARSAVWVVECKAWRGRLVAGADSWVSWSSPRRGAPVQHRRRNPVKQARAQTAAVLKQLKSTGLGTVPVREVVVFTDPDVDLDGVRDEGFVLHLDELPSFFRIGPAGEGAPMDARQRGEVCDLLERMPAWDFLEMEGGGRRGRFATDHLELRTSAGLARVPLADIHRATFRLHGWPVLRLAAQLVPFGNGEPVEGRLVDPTARLWLKESDGTTRPYPACIVRGFVRGGSGQGGKRTSRPPAAARIG